MSKTRAYTHGAVINRSSQLYLRVSKFTNGTDFKRDTQCTYNVTLRCVVATTVAVEEQ